VLTLAELLRSHRVAARLTQAELAERAGISERAVSDVERGVRTRVYPATAELLADALGLEGAGRVALTVAAKGAAPRRAAPLDGWRSLRRTPLVGRAAELADLLDALSGTSRLVTVTGTGGIGKSRLAAEACAVLHGTAPEAVAWVGLAGLTEPDLLVPTLAAALAVPGSGEGLLPALARELDARRALLVLDTFEQLLSAAGEVAALLDATDGLRVLVTSRAPLRVRGEQELPVGSLPLTAVEVLFRQRARAARPDLALEDDEVAAVCGRLGGVPLAVELAAARVRHLSLRSLSEQLARPLEVLTGGERDLPERHRAMASTIEWSYDLLTPPDRLLLRRLAVFADTWDLPDAERVCGSRCLETLDALGRLCEHGLVQLQEGVAQTRWSLRDPIRDFAAARLVEEAEDLDTARRHATLFAELA
jgi:predicted ATPase/DNA-binding XRE family transcriptional regulator